MGYTILIYILIGSYMAVSSYPFLKYTTGIIPYLSTVLIILFWPIFLFIAVREKWKKDG